MMGNIQGDDPDEFGLIPRICFGSSDVSCFASANSHVVHLASGIFEQLSPSHQKDGQQVVDEVLMSHLEIYNETVRDLLTDNHNR